MRQRGGAARSGPDFAGRSFRRSPGFTLVALLSLTLGIGATTAIFSVIYGVIIDPYPYAGRPRHLGARGPRGRTAATGTPTPRRGAGDAGAPGVLATVMATSVETVLLTGEFAPESFGRPAHRPTPSTSSACRRSLGRTLQPSDVARTAPRSRSSSSATRSGCGCSKAAPTPSGKTLRLNERPHTIVGVMPPRFGWYGERRLLAAAVAVRDGSAVDQPDRPARARRHRGRRRGAAAAALHRRLARGAAATASRSRASRRGSQLPGHHRRERRDADQPATAARRGRASCC